jgi:putative chitinase
MGITDLIAAGVAPTQARVFAPLLLQAFVRFNIVSVEQQCGFLAQAMHESQAFTRLEENLWYTTTRRVREMWPSRFPSDAAAAAVLRKPELLANRAYSNRLGNGSAVSGDGWRYRGRGIFMLTGRTNYAAASEELGRDYVAHPEWVAEPPDAVLTAGWFWVKAGCNALMGRGLFDQTTRRINPAMAGARERRYLYAEVQSALLAMA